MTSPFNFLDESGQDSRVGIGDGDNVVGPNTGPTLQDLDVGQGQGAGQPRPTPTPTPTPRISCDSLGLIQCGFFEIDPDAGCGPDSTCQQYAEGVFCCTPVESPPIPVVCNYIDQEELCSTPAPVGPGLEGYIGRATRKVVETDSNGNPLPLTCAFDPQIGITGAWDVSGCRSLCETVEETSDCRTQFGDGYLRSETLTRRVLRKVNNENTPVGCTLAGVQTTDYDRNLCTPPPNIYTTTIVANPAVGGLVRGRSVNGTTQQTPFVLTTQVVANIGESVFFEARENDGYTFTGWYLNGALWSNDRSAGIRSSENNTYEARFERISERETCTRPTELTRTIDVVCTSISNNFIGGTARQQQVARYDANVEGPGECPYTWENSGQPDTSTCQVVDTPRTCTPPSGGSTRNIIIPCSQINSSFTRGEAIQQQIRRVDTTRPGPGECPYTWENSGAPDTGACVTPVFWRNCVTGQLVEGTPPTSYREVDFLEAGGGLCWEPVTELGFEPNLSEALRYSYQRGSSTYPIGKNIKVTNPSYGIAYRVTMTTNSDITLSTRNGGGNNGTISFIIAPRSSETVTVNITPQLLQALQDGLSALSMSVEYQRVIT